LRPLPASRTSLRSPPSRRGHSVSRAERSVHVMGLYNKYEFPHMYTSPELNAATRIDRAARKNNVISEFFYSERRASRVPRQGIHLHQRWQRPAPRFDADRSYVNDIENVSKEKGKAGREGRPRCSSFGSLATKAIWFRIGFCLGKDGKFARKIRAAAQAKPSGVECGGVGYAVAVARKPPVPTWISRLNPGKLKIA